MNRRAIIGISAIVLLSTFFLPTTDQGMVVARNACIKVGFVMAAAWAAYPDLQRIPVWLLVIGFVGVGLILWRPPLAFVVVPIMIAVWFLRPRQPKASK